MRASRITAASVLAAAAAPSTLWAQGGGGDGGLYDINTGLSVWTLLVFGILLFTLSKYAWGPLLGMLEEREQGIQSNIDEAARQNQEAARLLAEHKEQLADARRQASELIAEGRAAGDKVRQDVEAAARTEAQDIIERARAEIERERDAAIETLRRESVEIALAAAARLVEGKIDQATDRQLVESYLGQLQAGD